MSKLVRKPLSTKVGKDNQPCRVLRNGKWVRVEAVLDRWCDTGCWWEGESPKLFYRLQLKGGGIWEVFFDFADGSWSLYKVYD